MKIICFLHLLISGCDIQMRALTLLMIAIPFTKVLRAQQDELFGVVTQSHAGGAHLRDRIGAYSGRCAESP